MKTDLVKYGNQLWEEVVLEQQSEVGNQSDLLQNPEKYLYQDDLSALNRGLTISKEK